MKEIDMNEFNRRLNAKLIQAGLTEEWASGYVGGDNLQLDKPEQIKGELEKLIAELAAR